jgi:hypothetical protein
MRADRDAMQESCALASQHRSTVEIRNGVPPVLSIVNKTDRWTSETEGGRAFVNRNTRFDYISSVDSCWQIVKFVQGRDLRDASSVESDEATQFR